MPIADWTPTVDAVGAILRTRTRDRNGNEIGTFNEDTVPTGDQVVSLITTAAGDLALAVGPDLPEAVWQQASSVATYRAAMLVEITFFPEQVALGRSPYPQLRELYLDALKDLRVAVDAAGGDLPGATDAAEAAAPSWGFEAVPTPLDRLLGTPPENVPGVVLPPVPWAGGLYQ